MSSKLSPAQSVVVIMASSPIIPVCQGFDRCTDDATEPQRIRRP